MRLTGTTSETSNPERSLTTRATSLAIGTKSRKAVRCRTKDHKLIRLRLALAHAGGDNFSKLQTGHLVGDVFEILWVVVLAVDEDNFLGTPGYIQLSHLHHAEVTRAQPTVRRVRNGIHFRVFIIAARHVLAPDLNMSHVAIRKRAILVVGDSDADRKESRFRQP